jgi:putative acetyltransferase
VTGSVRARRPDDAAAVAAVLTDAFGEDGAHVAELDADLQRGPARISLVAERAGLVVGSVTLSRCWIDAPRALVEVLVLSPLGVTAAHQRRGVGGELVRAALAEAEAARAPIVLLEGEPDYYPRFGFVQGAPLGLGKPSIRIPDRAFQVITLPDWQPWMTGALVYCDAFWRHDAVGLRGTGQAG